MLPLIEYRDLRQVQARVTGRRKIILIHWPCVSIERVGYWAKGLYRLLPQLCSTYGRRCLPFFWTLKVFRHPLCGTTQLMTYLSYAEAGDSWTIGWKRMANLTVNLREDGSEYLAIMTPGTAPTTKARSGHRTQTQGWHGLW